MRDQFTEISAPFEYRLKTEPKLEVVVDRNPQWVPMTG